VANVRVRAKITPDLPAAVGTGLFAKIENWSLKICHWQLKTPFPIANDKFSIFNHLQGGASQPPLPY
jgi:hypothetical protein